tara:strand:- start:504 stop:737 length:234 start_codon:yes stop_codon:yes gene_type:complete
MNNKDKHEKISALYKELLSALGDTGQEDKLERRIEAINRQAEKEIRELSRIICNLIADNEDLSYEVAVLRDLHNEIG